MTVNAIVDTSIFIAAEHGCPLGRAVPDQVSVSVVTLAEPEPAVLTARDSEPRAQRLATLTHVREQMSGHPADDLRRLRLRADRRGRACRRPQTTRP